MISPAGTIISGSTVLEIVVASVVAGLGVTIAFSLLIYCADRATTFRREHQWGAAAMFQAGVAVALVTVVGLIVYGLVLATSKPK